MRVTQYPVAFIANDQQQLGVRFKQANPINHETARFLQPLCFLNIVFLIKTCLHFKQHRHVLAVLGCVQERLRYA
ncbi:hypothetical protein D3C87_2051530 [compost metagenome]